MKNKKKWADNKFAKYLIIIVLFIMQAIGFGVASNIQPAFVPSASSMLYQGKTTLFLLLFTISSVGSSLVQPLIAKLYDKVNVKIIFSIGSVVSGGFMMLSGLTVLLYKNNATEAGYSMFLYVMQIMVQVGTLLFSSLGIPFMIGLWFPNKSRSMMLGICMAGGAVGNMVWQPIVTEALKTNWLNVFNIPNSQWAGCYFLFGGISVAVMLTLSLIFIYDPKFVKDDVNANSTSQEQFNDVKLNGAGALYTMRLPSFWILLIGYCILAFGITAFSTNYYSFVSRGLSWATNSELGYLVGLVGTFFAVGCLLGNLLGSILFSTIDAFWSMLIGGASRIVGMSFFFMGVLLPWLAPIGALITGLSVYTYTSGPAILSNNLFGKKDSLVIIGFLGISFAVGYAVANPAFGAITDSLEKTYTLFGKQVLGNWGPVFFVAIACLAIGTLFICVSILKIKSMGFEGIFEYSNTKYNRVIYGYKFIIWFSALKIWLTKKDFRVSEEYQKKYNLLSEKFRTKKSEKLLAKNKIWYDNIVARTVNSFEKKQTKLNIKLEFLSKQSTTNEKQIKKYQTKLNILNFKHNIRMNDLNVANLKLTKFYTNKYTYINELISREVYNKYKSKLIKSSVALSNKIEKVIGVANTMLEINNQWTEFNTLDYIERYDYEIIRIKDFFEKWICSQQDKLLYSLKHNKDEQQPDEFKVEK